MFGYTKDEAVGKGLYMLYDRDDPKRFKQTISAGISKHRKWEARTNFHRKDGSVGECEVLYTPLLDEARRPIALVGVNRPAGQASTLAAAIAPAAAAASPAPSAQASEQRAQHRLRQSLQTLADVMSAQEDSHRLNEDARAELENNRARVEALALLQDLIEEGGDFERVDFGQYVRKLVQFSLAKFGPEHAGIEVHLNVKGIVIPVPVAQPLAIILFELLSNALRHAFVRRDKGTVGVSMGIGDESGWMVVNDDGVGLPSGFDIGGSAGGAGLKIASKQAKLIHGEVKLVDALDTEIQVGFRLNGAT